MGAWTGWPRSGDKSKDLDAEVTYSDGIRRAEYEELSSSRGGSSGLGATPSAVRNLSTVPSAEGNAGISEGGMPETGRRIGRNESSDEIGLSRWHTIVYQLYIAQLHAAELNLQKLEVQSAAKRRWARERSAKP